MITDLPIPDCTVGLYVGGMKQVDLDITATKRIIIATYDMAEEAFDCKSLNTLIYATPHKNIKQAVGRILREEKQKRKFIPLIIDIQDIFSTFNAWNKLREKYYKKEGYPMKIFDVIVKSKSEIPEIIFNREISNSKSNSKTSKTSKGNSKTSKTTKCKINDNIDNNDSCDNESSNDDSEDNETDEIQTEIDF